MQDQVLIFARKGSKPLSWAQKLLREKTKKLQRENTTSCLKRSLHTRYKLILLILGRGWPEKPDFFFWEGVGGSGHLHMDWFIRPSSHLRTLFHQTTSGLRRLSYTYVTPSFFHANNMQIKINIPQAEQVDLRLVSGLRSLLSLSWDSLNFAYLLASALSQSTCTVASLHKLHLTQCNWLR